MADDRADYWERPRGIVTGDAAVAFDEAWAHYGKTGDDSLPEALRSGDDPDSDAEIGLAGKINR